MSSVEAILSTEFSDPFVQGMKDRMVVSFYKYGLVSEAYPHKVNAITSLTDRLRKYAETGNTEFLIDAANFAMIEFMHPSHPSAFFEGTDSDQSPGRRSKRSGIPDDRDNQSIGTNRNSELAKFR
ncbi:MULTISPECIES: hypothetical protein [Mesorhizobium]|uniref:hypothetical protein n=1 Tax=Mesorhizobium TaxID=68287 RepID=UPI0007A939D6|nr:MULTISPECIES: hypothetical protein [Mesorhizobium]AMX93649.1 hypothetical protein A4R28_11330 [Mesorhizobium ciceri]MDF3208340.1 hypothetical protein [Mesorhizobium sp. LMG15046]MDF3229088.1 hypothetical protein [Mesorhizobium sp. DSM 30133]RUU22198.1 hypothetical protein EOC84_03560 [Mesorhizobium sp. Primo-B]RUU37892.1 hypothetical protein EOC83_16655 [Mesorhizobium sp. Primo-A]